MFMIWRRFIGWLRSILIACFITKRTINWNEKVGELGEIIVDTTKEIDKKRQLPSSPTIEPKVSPISNYDIVPKPHRRWFRDLLRR